MERRRFAPEHCEIFIGCISPLPLLSSHQTSIESAKQPWQPEDTHGRVLSAIAQQISCFSADDLRAAACIQDSSTAAAFRAITAWWNGGGGCISLVVTSFSSPTPTLNRWVYCLILLDQVHVEICYTLLLTFELWYCVHLQNTTQTTSVTLGTLLSMRRGQQTMGTIVWVWHCAKDVIINPREGNGFVHNN